METRHYIGVTPLGRLHMTVGPAAPEDFEVAATEPVAMQGGNLVYPVSAEVAAEWDSFDSDDEDDVAVTPDTHVSKRR